VAFCRACSTVLKLSDLVSSAGLAGVDPASPPRGCSFSSDGVTTVVSASARSAGTAFGCLLIALFWNGIVSVFVLLTVASTLHHIFGSVPAWFPAPQMKTGNSIPIGMTLFLWVFLTPFILIGLGLLSGVFLAVAGRVEVKIRGDDGLVFVGCGPLGWRRRFDAREVTTVGIGQTEWKQDDQAKPVVVIECGRKIRFGSLLKEERRNWIAAVLRQVLVG
jgi:hypothetical protein